MRWRTREPFTEELYGGATRTVTAVEHLGVLLWWHGPHLLSTFVHESRPSVTPLPFSVTGGGEYRLQGMAGTLIHRSDRLHDGRIDTAWASSMEGAEAELTLRVAPWIRAPELHAVVLIPATDGTPPPAWVVINNGRVELNAAPMPTTVWFAPRTTAELSLTLGVAPTAAGEDGAVGLSEILLLGTTATRYYLRSSYR